jgi:hypothetical protein
VSAPTGRPTSPRFARAVSNTNLLVWLALPGLVVGAMATSVSAWSLGALAFLGVIFAFLGGLGIVGALVGRWHATRAFVAMSRGDSEGVRNSVRAALRANLVGGGLQVALFALSFYALTKLHH